MICDSRHGTDGNAVHCADGVVFSRDLCGFLHDKGCELVTFDCPERFRAEASRLGDDISVRYPYASAKAITAVHSTMRCE